VDPLVLVVVLVVLVVAVGATLLLRARRSARTGDRPSAPGAAAPPPRRPFAGEGLGDRIRAALAEGGSDRSRALEDVLVRADVGPAMAARLVERIDARDGGDPLGALRDEIVAILGDDARLHLPEDRLGVILVVGVNGSGKTTTIGKLAHRLSVQGRRVSIAASDTFRAAAGEQLATWAARADAHLVGQGRGADPGAVAFDAVTSARARGSDVLIVDTAGRLHTATPLMDELAKIRRVIEKAGAAVDETLLVLDAQTGQNGIAQARAFTDVAQVSGVVLAKTDGSARGGIVLAVREALGVPIRFVGTGEGVDDLREFDARGFADRLLS
jgi:fused signal recognition particle receptor